jgi:hercynylcysteine S-oxide lyase
VIDWTSWTARRPPAAVLHLDSAAAGRQSLATLEATARHARSEAELGAYVAQEQAREVGERLRGRLAGLFGVPAGGVAFVESATAALTALLASWPLRPGDRVGVVPAEWGPNVELLEYLGLAVESLPTEDGGRIDLDQLQRRLHSDPPALVHLTQVTSHRALVQPVAEAAAICRAVGVPLWVDAAQALGHVDVTTGADAVYATSRKWLAGPRGVGILAIAERHWDHVRPWRPALMGAGLPPPRYLESHEATIAGRVGLANAVEEFVADGPSAVHARLAETGRRTQAALAELPGWSVVGPADGAVTALRPLAGQDVAATRARLLAEHRIVVTACGVARAARDMSEPLLRVSPHVDCSDADLERLRAALERTD